jgi:hypothetical protein
VDAMTTPLPFRCPYCSWLPSGELELYCLFHWAEQAIAGRKCCYCGEPAAWFVGRRDPVCTAHGGKFPVEKPGPYEDKRRAGR